MKVLYAIQGTGNGHISRAIELYPYLKKYGQVDFMLSGSNANLPSSLPVKYKSKGLSLFYKHTGGLDYLKILRSLSLSVIKDAKKLQK
jgi:UDP-N-acetylglucosamine:LPS N-acetylglucosamine transferase